MLTQHPSNLLSAFAGSGQLSCKDCGFSKDITGSITSHDSSQTIRGYQCQDCGQIQGIRGDVLYPQCACGGSLSRHRYVFCPECRSLNVNYSLKVIY